MSNNLASGILNKVKLNSLLCAALISFIIHNLLPINSIFDVQTLSYFAIVPLLGWLLYSILIYLLIELGCYLIHKRKVKMCAYDKKNCMSMKITYERYTIEMPANKFKYKA